MIIWRARDKKCREAWAERRRNHFRARPLATVNEGGEATAVAAPSFALVQAAAAPARAVRASPPASTTPTSEDKAAAVEAPTTAVADAAPALYIYEWDG
jgi:hypothetical protein